MKGNFISLKTSIKVSLLSIAVLGMAALTNPTHADELQDAATEVTVAKEQVKQLQTEQLNLNAQIEHIQSKVKKSSTAEQALSVKPVVPITVNTLVDVQKNKLDSLKVESKNLESRLSAAKEKLEKAETKGWSKERVVYEFNRLVASPVYAGDTGRAAWSGLGGVLKIDKLRKTLKEDYGFSDYEAGLFIDSIENQQGSSPSKKDLAHEAIQLSTFTEQAWGDRDLSTNDGRKELLAHVLSTLGNSMTIGELPINTERYESSFKGDVDSTRYDDNDFTSDLDAINVYDRISKMVSLTMFLKYKQIITMRLL